MTIEVEVGNIVQVVDDRNLIVIDQGNTVEVAAMGAQGPTGPTGATGATGPQGPSGVISVTAPITNSGSSTSAVIGVNVGTTSATVAAGDRGLPAGGATGQALVKTSATDYATTWVTPGSLGGLVLISSATFTAVTSWNLPDNTFSATYRNYRIIIDVASVAGDADFSGRLRASGTNATGNNYRTSFVGVDTVGNFQTFFANNTSSWAIGDMESAMTRQTYVFDFCNPFVAARTTVYGSYWVNNKADTFIACRSGGFWHGLSTSYDSFAFISTQNITGTYWVYGYR